MRHVLPIITAITLTLSACAEHSMASDSNDAFAPQDDTGIGETDQAQTLRVDIDPGSGSGYRAQSYMPGSAEDWSDLRIELAPTVTYDGIVLGFDAWPYTDLSDAEGAPPDVVVPGDDSVAVLAQVRAMLPDTVTESSQSTTDLGEFAIELPAARGYVLAVVPIDPAELPFLISTDVDLLQSMTDLEYLDYGLPVYGHVIQDGDLMLSASSNARLVDVETGIAGPSTPIASDGSFMLRAYEGDYKLVVGANDTSSLPTVEQDLQVVADQMNEVVIDQGRIAPVDVRGRVVDSEGTTVLDATVRFTSTRLFDAHGTSQVITQTDRWGEFQRNLLPGDWSIEIIPSYDTDGALSPVMMSFEITEATDLGDLDLPARVPLEGQVLDPFGAPAANVVVKAQELDFDGYRYSGVTDDQGMFSIAVPDVALSISLTPANDAAAITHFDVTPPTGEQVFALDSGRPVHGQLTGAGEPIAFALVELRDSNGDLYGTTFTDELGEFSVRVQDTDAR